MMILVIGGSKCGKSHYAESIFRDVHCPKYYLATMQPYGNDAFETIHRHRKNRADKGFLTAEQYTDIDKADICMGASVLLECMGNLLANEMFQRGQMIDCTDKIIADVLRLNQKTNMLVIVSNQVGSDGLQYDSGTTAYISALGRINRSLAYNADRVVECVYGIPVVLKG